MNKTTPYVVKLQNFTGPLDLLLQLIRRRKLDICDISLSTVTNDFLHYLSATQLSAQDTNSFIEVASKLALQKSRALLFTDDSSDTDDAENSAELTRQLTQFAKLKWAAAKLASRNSHRARPRQASVSDRSLRAHSLRDLSAVANEILVKTSSSPSSFQLKRPVQIDLQKKLSQQLFDRKRIGLASLGDIATNKKEKVILFSLILELLRSGTLQLTTTRGESVVHV